MYDWWLSTKDPEYQQLVEKMNALQREQEDIKARSTTGYVMQERESRPIAYVLNRGEYDQRKEKVSAVTPAMCVSERRR